MSKSIAQQQNKISIMLVDDSVVVRGLLRRIIEKDSSLTIAASASNGLMAVETYARLRPDVVLMDIEMPEMDGISALQEMIALDPDARVIMCSSSVSPGSVMAIQAFKAGALECLLKPSSSDIDRGEGFGSLLLRAVHLFAKSNGGGQSPLLKQEKATDAIKGSDDRPSSSIILRPFPTLDKGFKVVAIGASTGGPAALQNFLAEIDPASFLQVPIFVTQHIPVNFSETLVQTLASTSRLPVQRAQDLMPIKNGHVYIAPGGAHLTLSAEQPLRIRVSDEPAVNFCKPSIDVMLSSLVEHYGGGILSVFFTGMGMDGFLGVKNMQETTGGNVVLAQDQESSVVWGIPGAIAKAGYCNAVMPLKNIPRAVQDLLARRVPV